MSETWDVTIQRTRPKGEPHTGADTVTYRVQARNPADARRKAGGRAGKRWDRWHIIDQKRAG